MTADQFFQVVWFGSIVLVALLVVAVVRMIRGEKL